MRTPLLVISVLLFVFSSGCTAPGLFEGSIEADSYPAGAEVYLDGEYKGTTPCVINSVRSGVHEIELRYNDPRYPNFRDNITVESGKTLEFYKDLSENSEVRVYGGIKGSGIFAAGDEIRVTGYSLGGSTGTEILIVYNKTGEEVYKSKVILSGDESFDHTLQTDGFKAGKYTARVQHPDGSYFELGFAIEDEKAEKIRILNGIVKKYYEEHTYLESEEFMCADMVTDIWNIIETADIRAVIAAGNIDDSSVSPNKYQHAWVLAETSPGRWTGVEATGGYLVFENDNYFKGHFFENPKDFKDYIYERENFNRLSAEIDDMVEEFNSKYPDRSLSPDEYNLALEEKALIEEKQSILESMKSSFNEKYQVETRKKEIV
ncbi:PEGA domain-containing protein [Methanoplanus sp. FWC-SCC4]|uniref:PEGA domain-containing protein n=1 Tax=Methanochimaera problematica TaxID=2609417 RepID=A0AA97FB77_9EURY|nr:PEGA domain-containing protein [Methanoplanus sp. FWC-SCC4]WOF15362.1 PEGA domain-containing protein [Methanoplanus sp. FWC-SCC4]